MQAQGTPIEVRMESLLPERLDAVLQVEQRAYEHPWNRTHFLDALEAGYQAQLLWADQTLLGYFVAMKGVDEVHLLNITVDPVYQRQGWARILLEALAIWGRSQAAQWAWLEVRVGNVRAMQVYESCGFRTMGRRKDYYPAGGGQREDALVMCLKL